MELLIIAELMEEAEGIARREFQIYRKTLRDNYNPFHLPDCVFTQNFRLAKELVNFLCVRLGPSLASQRPYGLTPQQKIFSSLEFLASGSYQRGSVANHNQVNLCQTSVSKSLHQVLTAMDEILVPELIHFPSTVAARTQIKAEFFRKYGIPGVVGAVDCTRVAMNKPKNNEHVYFCHKRCHCINVQLVCDSDLKILAVNPRHGGGTHDAFIWRHSTVNEYLRVLVQNGEEYTWVLGDSAYPIQPWTLTPITNTAPNTPERRYDEAHIQARNPIERTNGVLKQIWRCLLHERVLHYDPPTVRKIIRTCCALHNLGLSMDDYLNQVENLVQENEIVPPQPLHRLPPQAQAEFHQGLLVRTQLIATHFNN